MNLGVYGPIWLEEILIVMINQKKTLWVSAGFPNIRSSLRFSDTEEIFAQEVNMVMASPVNDEGPQTTVTSKRTVTVRTITTTVRDARDDHVTNGEPKVRARCHAGQRQSVFCHAVQDTNLSIWEAICTSSFAYERRLLSAIQ